MKHITDIIADQRRKSDKYGIIPRNEKIERAQRRLAREEKQGATAAEVLRYRDANAMPPVNPLAGAFALLEVSSA